MCISRYKASAQPYSKLAPQPHCSKNLGFRDLGFGSQAEPSLTSSYFPASTPLHSVLSRSTPVCNSHPPSPHHIRRTSGFPLAWVGWRQWGYCQDSSRPRRVSIYLSGYIVETNVYEKVRPGGATWSPVVCYPPETRSSCGT